MASDADFTSILMRKGRGHAYLSAEVECFGLCGCKPALWMYERPHNAALLHGANRRFHRSRTGNDCGVPMRKVPHHSRNPGGKGSLWSATGFAFSTNLYRRKFSQYAGQSYSLDHVSPDYEAKDCHAGAWFIRTASRRHCGLPVHTEVDQTNGCFCSALLPDSCHKPVPGIPVKVEKIANGFKKD